MLTGAPFLAEGTLCLTFDDGPGETDGPGPGPRTTELAEHLADEGVPATFFMCGKQIRLYPHSVARVVELGHGVGNHTDTHLSLTGLQDAAILDEVRAAHKALREAGVAGPLPFRPPYGDWDERCASAVHADDELARSTVGVVGWDVDPQDWASWEARDSAVIAATSLVDACVRAGRGIVLLHDCSADPEPTGARLRAGNRALEAARIAIPALRAHGFSFASLRELAPERW